MIPPVVLGLVQLAPMLMRFFGVGQESTAVAEKVIDIANTVAGTKNPSEALDIISRNSDKLFEFKQAVMVNETELEKLYLQDVQSARARDVELAKTGQRNYRADFMFLLAVAVICWLVWIIWKNPDINEYVKGIFTLLIGRFTGYLDTIYGFEFGTTRSSRGKDEAIKNLTEK